MLKLWKVPASHEELFVERYEQLLGWALRLTGHDRERAEDLVHDLFVQFVLSRPNLQLIENLDGYLYVMLKNTQLSRSRRVGQEQRSPLLIDYDSLEVGLRHLDPASSLQVQHELRQICRYAVQRKESSKAGGVLILRFFHGYYPSEIARIIRSTRPVVARWLQLARAEVKLYLTDSGSLGFLNERGDKRVVQPQAQRAPDFLGQLSASIFSSGASDCNSGAQLKNLYKSTESGAIETKTLAHLVSCRVCLDQVNDLLDLPRLAERFPADTIDRDKPSHGGPTSGSWGGGKLKETIRRGRRRITETFEHRPKELRIAANGYLVGAQKISSELSEQELSLNVPEPINFIEILSEQRIRLLSLFVTAPPEGTFEQRTETALSDGRTLEATVKFTSAWPTLHVAYHDPTFNEAESLVLETTETTSSTQAAADDAAETNLAISQRPSLVLRIWRAVGHARFWLRPATVTALVALMIISALLLVRWRAPIPSMTAVDLLQRSSVVEAAIAAKPDQVVHRMINLTEESANGEILAHHRIEVWQSADRGISASRLYDERGTLIAGDWRRRDGVRTLYQHGSRPQLQLAPNRGGEPARLSFENAWRLLPSAAEFSALIKHPEATQIQEQSTRYFISYTNSETDQPQLVSAILVIDRGEMRAVEQTLVLRQGDDTRSYKFVEASFERHAPATVTPSVFEPETELFAAKAKDESGKVKEAESRATSSLPAPAAASAALEVEVLEVLKQVGADLGEQVDVTRTPNGMVQVNGIVETAQRKAEILRALQPVINNPAVRVDINTVGEALAKQRRTGTPSSAETIEVSEQTANRIPVDDDLRRYLASRGVAESQLDEQVRQFASQSLSQSRQSLMYAGALKRLSGRFSAPELQTLDRDARTKWLAIIRERAASLQQETASLRQRLGPIFFPSFSSGDVAEGNELATETDLIQAIARLFDQCTANDRILRAALTTSPESGRAAAIKSNQFGRALRSTELLALRIQTLTRKLSSARDKN